VLYKLLIVSLLGLGGLSTFAAERMLAVSSQQIEELCGDKNSSHQLKIGTEIRGIQTKMSWGEIVSRLPANDGWKLSTGNKVLDTTYGVKWEIDPSSLDREGANTLRDGDGKAIQGDHDHLWFKIKPPEDDIEASNLYNEIDQQRGLSTDGFYQGKIAFIYTIPDASSNVSIVYSDPSVLKYLTQTKPKPNLP
jgi:hypothetical protein